MLYKSLMVWVNYNISLTWILRPFGDDSPKINHDSQGSVVINPDGLMTSPAVRGLYQSCDNGTYKRTTNNPKLSTTCFHVFLAWDTTRPHTLKSLGWDCPSGMSWGWSVSNLVAITSMIPMFHKFSHVVTSICRVASKTPRFWKPQTSGSHINTLVICCSLL